MSENNMKKNIIITTKEEHIWQLIEKARQGNTVRVLGIGNSMRPLLKGGRDYIDLIAVNQDTQLEKNDVIFYKSHNDHYVLHRIYSVSEEGYYLIGDGNLKIEPLLRRESIYLKAVGFVRKGKYISIESKWYQCYVRIWTRLLPIRANLLRWVIIFIE
jgi:hypothetical protein